MSERTFIRAPFTGLPRQHAAATFGMWIFLASEVLLFSALFAAYTLYRQLHADGFLAAAREIDVVYGTINTAILMTSSLTIALSGHTARAGFYLVSKRLLVATIILGALFLVLKGFEYREDIHKNLFPGSDAGRADPGAGLFFTFYWIMTGLHALHVSGGLIAILRLLFVSHGNNRWLSGSASAEVTALYWHLVDVIWIVLYPLLYLAGRSHG